MARAWRGVQLRAGIKEAGAARLWQSFGVKRRKPCGTSFCRSPKEAVMKDYCLVVGCCVFLCVWALCDNLSLCDVCVPGWC